MRQRSVSPCAATYLFMSDFMSDESINLLPQERQRALVREYRLRLGIVVAIVVTVLTFVAGLLLVPTYVFLTRSATAKEAQLANVEATLSSANEVALATHLAALSSDTTRLVALGSAPSISATIRMVLAVPRPGVTLIGFTYTTATEKLRGKLALSGVAASRDALRRYQLALQVAPFAATAELPVSAYAKDADISFTIIVNLSP